ncbi:hypothetical protein ACHAXA_010797 [Cyclostephanos tholiformis]|uniref:Endonuclease/exonuclease/phosphatase domain-containing protein n=1 Tax=Cyclostephanos tholiformis TaxID=382380 RepID=A0ABD3RUF8_9STRA
MLYRARASLGSPFHIIIMIITGSSSTSSSSSESVAAMIVDPLRDLLSFARQLRPSHRRYRFSHADLPPRKVTTNRPPPRDDDDDDDDDRAILATFDLLSYNVNHRAVSDTTRRNNIIRAITSSMADVALLQETNADWEYHLSNNVDVSSTYPQVRFHHPGTNDRMAGGIAILSRWNVRDYYDDDATILDMSMSVDGSVFPAMICGIDVPTIVDDARSNAANHHGSSFATVHVANVHLRPPLELDGTCRLDTMRRTGHVRLGEVKELIRRASSSRPGGTDGDTDRGTDRGGRGIRRTRLDVIAGDFNGDDDDLASTYLASLGYVDALRRYVPRGKETHVWPFRDITNVKTS